MMSMERRILQELIYERVRASVNLCQLSIFERDLDTSIRRALAQFGGSSEQLERMAAHYLDDAWRRLEQEWHDMREQFGGLDDD